MPHRPISPDGPEGGSFWLIVGKDQLPPAYRQWARMTVVGRVLRGHRHTEPVLSLIYVRGRGMNAKHDGIWEHMDPCYVPSVPGSVAVGFGANRP